MRRAVSILAVAIAATVAGCGGGSSHAHTVVAAKQLAPYANDRSAETGHVVAAHDTGRVVASLGFELGRDGFSFENYGFIAGVEIDPHAMRELFGNGVCAGAASDSCTLTPAAQQWAAQTDAAMAGGHCFGFSVTALRFFTHKLDPNQFGGPTTFSLPFSPRLQGELAYGWAMQELAAVRKADIADTPTGTVQFLQKALANHGDVYKMGIFKPDGSDGHAVTPIAVESLGAGQYQIDIYDNNYPDTPRAIFVNTTNDSWTYNAAPDPSNPAGVYSGRGTTNPMNLVPLSAGLGTQPCPFCATAGASRPGMLRISLGGNPVNHGHLLITTADGKRIGYVRGRFVNDIPGASVFQPYLNQDWNAQPEPIYEVPAGGPVQVTLDGANATGTDAASVYVTGPGFGATVANLKPAAGFSDRIAVGAGGTGLALHASTSTSATAPTLQLARNVGAGGSELTATPQSLAAGASLGIALMPAGNLLTVTSSAAATLGPVALSLRRAGPTGIQTVHSAVVLGKGQMKALTLGSG